MEPGGEVTGDLAERRRQDVEHHEPRSRVEPAGEPLGDGARLLRAVLRGFEVLALQIVDVLSEVQ